MSYYEYCRSRDLAKYHTEKRHPHYPNDMMEYTAKRLTEKYKRMETEFPEYKIAYEKYK